MVFNGICNKKFEQEFMIIQSKKNFILIWHDSDVPQTSFYTGLLYVLVWLTRISSKI